MKASCGHGRAHARGLCRRCYQALWKQGGVEALADHPRVLRGRDEVVEDLLALGLSLRRPLGPQIRLLAPRLGMTEAGAKRALQRWRAAA